MRSVNLPCNVGGLERRVRITLGVALIAIGYLATLPFWGAVVVYLVGAVSLITGITHYCPLNALLGINTCEPRVIEKH